MSGSIVIIDYGMGNLRSVQKALERLGYAADITDDPQEVLTAAGLILPGVGAFGDAMIALEKRGLDRAIKEAVGRGVPFLGICLGMQLLFAESEEGGHCRGLGILAGKVVRLSGPVRVPHMGWNAVHFTRPSPLISGLPAEPYFYFVHSYVAVPEQEEVILGVTDYGGDFVAAVNWGHIFGVQFHPEKSSDQGLRLLQNFGGIVRHAGYSGH
ncbi:MAG: imidazole glycerol-phosphate synthase subunit HisH [Clostridia bacterium]|nr:imidazole glycerol-phosphate synthase subunit HisH [Clostridia bacterium]